MTSMIGGRSRRLALAGLAGVIVAAALLLAVLATDDEASVTQPDEAFEVTPRLLAWTSVESVEDDLWVFGGLAGPIGTSPPMSSDIPEGWGTNRTVIVYGTDGSLRERLTLPPLRSYIQIGDVVAHDAGRLIVANTACYAPACDTKDTTFLFRVEPRQSGGSEVTPIPLNVPQPPTTTTVGSGTVRVIGVVDDILWLEQQLDTPLDGLSIVPIRILAVDLESRVVEVVDLPGGTFIQGTVCLMDHDLFAAGGTLVDSDVQSISLHRRSAESVEGAWDLVGRFEPNDDVYHGSTHCLDASAEVVVSVNAYPTQLWTHTSGTDGFAPPALLAELDGGEVLGAIEPDAGRMFAVAQAGSKSQRVFLAHPKGGPWTEVARVDWRVWPAIVGGQLVDVTKAMQATHVPAPAFEVIDIDPDG